MSATDYYDGDDDYYRREENYDRKYSDEGRRSRDQGSFDERRRSRDQGSFDERRRSRDQDSFDRGSRGNSDSNFEGSEVERWSADAPEGELEPVEESIAAWEVVPKKFDGQTEYTLLLIKPDACKHENEILRRIAKEGFLTLQRRKVLLWPEQASLFYEEHYGDPKFPRLVAYMASGPVVAVCLTRERAICGLRELLGPADALEARKLFPECMRAKYGHRRDSLKNGLHGSDDPAKAEFEIHFFFPELTLYPLWTGDKAAVYLEEFVHPTLTDGLVEVARIKPVDPALHLAHWLLRNNPNRPTLTELLSLVPT